MSSNEGLLKRSNSLLRRRETVRGRKEGDEEVLPYRPVKKPPIVYTQVITPDDVGKQPFCVELPTPIQTQRNTWPMLPKEQKPGSYSFDQTPTLTRTPWELERRKRQPTWSSKSRMLHPRVFEQLPQEIYQCILDHVVASHTHNAHVDVSATNKELLSLCLVSRRWARVSVESLYREIWLPSNKPIGRRKLSMTRPKSRLDLLLRTLAEAPSLASLVRETCVTEKLREQLCIERKCDGPRGFWAHDAVTKVINMCPDVQRIDVHLPSATAAHSVAYKVARDSLLDAVCSRTGLMGHAWALDDSWPPWSSVGHFIDVHSNWQSLETMVLSIDTINCSSMIGLMTAITSRLPSLKHLAVINCPEEIFHNGTLLALPALKSLRLELLHGINDHGLQQLAVSRLSTSLERLSLVNLEISSFRTIQALLTHLTNLRRFTLVQDCSPTLPLALTPSSPRATFRSSNLAYLHWNTQIPGPAIEAIATSIRLGRLPNLRTIKAPCDYDGVLQSLCRPISRVPLTGNDLEFLDGLSSDRYVRSLRASRCQAQLRIRESRQQPGFNVVVQDEDSRTKLTHVIGSYLGDLNSRIEYSLEPDLEGSEYALAHVAEVLAVGARRGEGEVRVDLGLLF